KVQSALFVELLRGGEVERFAGGRAAQSLIGDVAERAILPGIRDRKKHSAVSLHENILFGRDDRRSGCRLARSRSCRRLLHDYVDAALGRFFREYFFCVIRNLVVHDGGHGRKSKAAAEKWNKAAQVHAMPAPAKGVWMGRGEVNEIE